MLSHNRAGILPLKPTRSHLLPSLLFQPLSMSIRALSLGSVEFNTLFITLWNCCQ
uniref:Uncharacterized protein n=1 Tax=Anguilla anguilla TaxID=7936 RepID=A0A0E9WV62_ANGAN